MSQSKFNFIGFVGLLGTMCHYLIICASAHDIKDITNGLNSDLKSSGNVNVSAETPQSGGELMPNKKRGIVDNWILMDFYLEKTKTKEKVHVFGENPTGVLMLHPEGRMVAIVTPVKQEKPDSAPSNAPPFKPAVSYSGLYKIDGDNKFITKVEISSLQNWVGTDQVRTFTLTDDRLDIVTPPFRMPPPDQETEVVSVLSWRRDTRSP